jgi:hypothetical protein
MTSPYNHQFMTVFGGLPVIVSEAATEVKIHWPFKNRSKRLHKKLTKRLGPQVTQQPTSYRMGNRLVIHPYLYAELMRQTKESPA